MAANWQLQVPTYILVYVISWVSVVFGNNCASNNVGRKLVIVRGAAERYYCFLPTLRALLLFPAYITRAINSKYYGKTMLLQINPICSF